MDAGCNRMEWHETDSNKKKSKVKTAKILSEKKVELATHGQLHPTMLLCWLYTAIWTIELL